MLSRNKKWNNVTVEAKLKNRNIACLTNLEEITQPSITKVLWLCKNCNHEWNTTCDSIINLKSGCPSCAGNLKHTERSVQKLLNERGDNLLVATLFNGDIHHERKVKLLCNNCDYMFINTLSNVTGKHQGCSLCNRGYGKLGKMWSLNSKNANVETIFYCVQVSNKGEDF